MAAATFGWSEDITIRNCVAYDNHRQGLSVISAVNLLVDNCQFANTWGTAPEAGIDLEPDTEKQRLVNCVIRNSTFENNNGNEILVYLKPLTTNSEPVSIRFEHCWARMTDSRLKPPEPGPAAGLHGVAGIAVGEVKDNGPKGLIEFIDCVTENTGKEGARVYDKSATSCPRAVLELLVPESLDLARPWRQRAAGAHHFSTCATRRALEAWGVLTFRIATFTTLPPGPRFSLKWTMAIWASGTSTGRSSCPAPECHS